MTPWQRKYRKAKRKPLQLLSRQSHRLYGEGYLNFLERRGLISRNTFYSKVKRRTLSNAVAKRISHIMKVEVSQWYEGNKEAEQESRAAEMKKRIDFSEIDKLL
jgi:hypothetical protein